jgi:hypothetical protein
MKAYQTSQYVVPRGGIFLGKSHSSFAGNSDGKMNIQSACALNTRYKSDFTAKLNVTYIISNVSEFMQLRSTNFHCSVTS